MSQVSKLAGPRADTRGEEHHRAMGERLVAWYREHGREMPWRKDPRDPYAVWISEVMLQQTRVVSVAPYYERFLAQFPNVHALARARLDDVLAAWSGLGYYRRARGLHAAALQIVSRFAGRIPATVEELMSLPGVGRYTASAIASLAYGAPVAVVDGNVSRVVARILALREPIDDRRTRRLIESCADAMLARDAPGAFNEAMMDLGATVCTPRDPACPGCPLRGGCEAFARSLQGEVPVMPPRRASPRVRSCALVVLRGNDVLVARRRSPGQFGGMWEPPRIDGGRSAARRSLLAGAVGARHWTDCGVIEHVLTHRVLAVQVLCARVGRAEEVAIEALPGDYDRAEWCEMGKLGERGVSVLARRVIALATSSTGATGVERSGAT